MRWVRKHDPSSRKLSLTKNARGCEMLNLDDQILLSDTDNREISPSPGRERVLMLVESLARGGAERQILALTHGLLQRGYEIEVFELTGVVAGQASFAPEFAGAGVRVRHAREFAADPAGLAVDTAIAGLQRFAPLLPANFASLCGALSQEIREFRPNIVNCWSDLANLIGGFVSSSMWVPRIVLGQRVLPPSFWFAAPKSDLYRQAYRALAENAFVVFVNNSAASIEEYENWMRLAPGAIRLVHNGFLPSSVNVRKGGERAACRAGFGLPPNAPVIGALMRFAPEKDPDLWLETAAAIAAARPDALFLLAGYGHGAIADELFQKRLHLGLDGRLVMPGAMTDVGQFYSAVDVFLLASRSENLPNVLIEAQAAGVPVVAPAVGGVGEAMLDGVTGLLVPDRSAQALAGAVLRILADDRWRERVEIEGPKFIARKFDHARMVRETMAIYGDDQRPPSGADLTFATHPTASS
jgi:glycosyltransferase involved in cell wall biosynthesis